MFAGPVLVIIITFVPTLPDHACSASMSITDHHRDHSAFIRTMTVPCVHPNRIVEPPYPGTLPVLDQFLLPDPNPGVCLMYRIEGIDV